MKPESKKKGNPTTGNEAKLMNPPLVRAGKSLLLLTSDSGSFEFRVVGVWGSGFGL